MATDLKNYGIRFSNVLRPVQNKDTHPLTVANDALGGLHITRSLAEIEKMTQRLVIGMEVVSLNEETAFDGKPEYGRWRLKDMKITCNHNTFNCPLYASLKSNKKCLFEHPHCRITSKRNFVWQRLYDDEPVQFNCKWGQILERPWQLKFIAADISLPNFYTDQITLNLLDNKPIEMIAKDGKIDKRLLRNDEIKVETVPKTIFFNERVLIDHSFFTAEEFSKRIRPARLDLACQSIGIGEKVQQVNLSLMYNLSTLIIDDNAKINYLRLANTKLESLDLREIKGSLEELILDNNSKLKYVYVNDSNYDASNPDNRIPLKRISIKNCPNLQIISISGSQVQTIDLRGCTNLRRLYADNTQITSIICQEDFIGQYQTDDKVYYGDIVRDTIHYFFRGNSMNEIALNGVYNSLYDATSRYCIMLHVGNTKYTKNSSTKIATDKGHIVCFCESETF